MKEQFRKAGYEITGEEDPADVYIINTCTVTNLADRKSRQYIRRMKKQCPQAVVAVTGCYAQVKPEEVAALPEVDIVAGTGEKNHLVQYVSEYLADHQKQKHILAYDALTSYHDQGIITSMDSRTRAYIKIQEGCNRFCSYCLIPFARGQVRSRDPQEIVLEAETLLAPWVQGAGADRHQYGTLRYRGGFRLSADGCGAGGRDAWHRDHHQQAERFGRRLSYPAQLAGADGGQRGLCQAPAAI